MNFFNQIVPGFARRDGAKNGDGAAQEFTVKPAFALNEKPEAWSLTVQLPGVAREGLEFVAEDNQITIRGARAWRQPEGWTSLHRESNDAPFELVLEHDNNVDVEKIQAELKHGVLSVTLPKSEAVKPRKIAIN